jgi:uncharacterized repeat protein (TIGR01451 family)
MINYTLTAQTWINYPGNVGNMLLAQELPNGQIVGTGFVPTIDNSDISFHFLSFNPITGQVEIKVEHDTVPVGVGMANTIDHQGDLVIVEFDSNDDPVFTKYDSTGQIIHQHIIEDLGIPPLFSTFKLIELSNGDFICLIPGYDQVRVYRLDSLGHFIWSQILWNHDNGYPYIKEAADSSLFLSTSYEDEDDLWKIQIVHLASDGTIIDIKEEVINDFLNVVAPIAESTDGTLVLISENLLQYTEETKLYKYNDQAELQWEFTLPLPPAYYGERLIEINENRIAVWGQNYTQESNPIFVAILDTLGSLINYTEYTLDTYVDFSSLELISDSRMLLAGFSGNLDGGTNFPYVLITDSLGQAAVTNIHGSLFLDTDDNCNLDSVDFTMANWLVGLVDTDTIYRATNSNGEYTFVVNEGTYELTAQFPAALYDHCSPMTIVDVPADVDSVFVDYAVTPLIFCPYLNIEVAAPFLRRCFTNTYHVLYQNQGTDVALDAYTEIELDQYLELISASIPFTPLGNSKYSFDLGDIPPGVEGHFTFEAYLSCGDSTILGMAHCVEAHIYPDTLCLLPDPLWSEASLVLDGLCDLDTDSVRFTITNEGNGPMNQNLEYIVIEDDIIMNSTSDPTQLDIGEQYKVALPSNGATWRLNVDQVGFHPGFSSPTLAIEGCGTDGNGDFTIGFVTMFPEDEQDHFVSIDCQENVGSYDPNYKEAGFKGYAENHYIEANQPLEYTIHFQNTGTDTAFTVILHDQLSPFLDHRSIQAGISSHNYAMDLDSTGLLKFTFNDILLPDSTTNEPASHGFVKFKIDQIPDNPVNTVITNTADIFFDFNDPITTNTVFHTIGEDFIEIQSFSSIYEALEAEIAVFPNPWAQEATLVLKGMNLEDAVLEIYSTDGRCTHQQKIRENITRIYRNALNPGLYYFRIVQGRRTIGTGQFIIAGE